MPISLYVSFSRQCSFELNDGEDLWDLESAGSVFAYLSEGMSGYSLEIAAYSANIAANKYSDETGGCPWGYSLRSVGLPVCRASRTDSFHQYAIC